MTTAAYESQHMLRQLRGSIANLRRLIALPSTSEARAAVLRCSHAALTAELHRLVGMLAEAEREGRAA